MVQVDGDIATASCYGTAMHLTSDQEKPWTCFVGSHDLHLTRTGGDGRIDSMRFHEKFVE